MNIMILKKCIAPEIIAGAIGAGASVAGAGIGALGTGKLNKKNRDWQEKMYKEQLADQRDLRNEQWNYLSPENQKKLYEEAGLNPAYMMTNGGAGASAIGGTTPSNSASVPSMPQYNPMDNATDVMDSIGTMIEKIYGNKKTSAETKSLIQSTKNLEVTLDILAEQANQAKIDTYIKQMTTEDEINKIHFESKQQEQEFKKSEAQARECLINLGIAETNARYAEQLIITNLALQNQQIAESKSRQSLIRSQKELTKKMTETEVQKCSQLIQTIESLKIDNYENGQIKELSDSPKKFDRITADFMRSIGTVMKTFGRIIGK